MEIFIFELPCEGARVYMEFRLIQAHVFQQLKASVLITRQHQLWDRMVTQSVSMGVPHEHWRPSRATGQGGGQRRQDAFRCLDVATMTTFALLSVLLLWAKRSPGDGVKTRAASLLEALCAQFFGCLSRQECSGALVVSKACVHLTSHDKVGLGSRTSCM